MQKSLRYSASIYSRRSLGGAVMSKPGNSEQARVEWICSTMVLHLLWKLGCLGDPWPDACWLYHRAWSPHPTPPCPYQAGTTTNVQAVKSSQRKSEQKMIRSIFKSKAFPTWASLAQHISVSSIH